MNSRNDLDPQVQTLSFRRSSGVSALVEKPHIRITPSLQGI